MTEHYVIEGILAGLLVFSELRHHFERRELLDRVMANNLPELVLSQNERRTVKAPKTVPLAGIEL